MSAEEVHAILDPETVGQLPKDIFAIQQVGVFTGTEGRTKTVIELTHSKGRVDRAVQYVVAYGSPDHRYKVFYGRIVWESEGDVIPEAAPVQTLFDPGVRYVGGKAYIGDVPAKGTGKVKKNRRPTVSLGDEVE